MQNVIDFFSKPFVWGLCLGLLFFLLSAWGHFKTTRELRRYRKHLSDKLELEARQYDVLRRERDTLTKENENLRLRVGQLNEKPDQRLARDLEIYCRAEKRMNLQAPGFAAAWETAKTAAAEEMALEDSGGSLPKRIFSRLFGSSGPRESERILMAESIPAAAPTNASTSTNGPGEPTSVPPVTAAEAESGTSPRPPAAS